MAALLLLIALVFATIIPMITTPMRRPMRMLRRHILQITPMGTSIDDVVDIINNKDDWRTVDRILGFGFAPLSPRQGPPAEHLSLPDLPRVGVQSVSTFLGFYNSWYRFFGLLTTSVDVFWGFNEDGELIDVFIWKVSS